MKNECFLNSFGNNLSFEFIWVVLIEELFLFFEQRKGPFSKIKTNFIENEFKTEVNN